MGHLQPHDSHHPAGSSPVLSEALVFWFRGTESLSFSTPQEKGSEVHLGLEQGLEVLWALLCARGHAVSTLSLPFSASPGKSRVSLLATQVLLTSSLLTLALSSSHSPRSFDSTVDNLSMHSSGLQPHR